MGSVSRRDCEVLNDAEEQELEDARRCSADG